MEYISKMKNVLVTGLAALVLGSFGGCTTENNIPVGLRDQGGAVTSMASLAIDDHQKGKNSRIDEICNYQGEKYIFENGEWIDTEESCTELGSSTGPSDLARILGYKTKYQLPEINTYDNLGRIIKKKQGDITKEYDYNAKDRTITRKSTNYKKDQVTTETHHFDSQSQVVKISYKNRIRSLNQESEKLTKLKYNQEKHILEIAVETITPKIDGKIASSWLRMEYGIIGKQKLRKTQFICLDIDCTKQMPKAIEAYYQRKPIPKLDDLIMERYVWDNNRIITVKRDNNGDGTIDYEFPVSKSKGKISHSEYHCGWTYSLIEMWEDRKPGVEELIPGVKGKKAN
jgi:YD repeat-containing protein